MPVMLVCGVINWDTALFVQSLPRPGEEVKVVRKSSFPGGKGANTAVAAARILDPGQVGMAGMLGSDSVAEEQIRILEHEGVDTSCISKQPAANSGTAYVIIDSKGEDMILTHMAANLMMTEAFVSSNQVSSAIDGASTITIIDPPLAVASAFLAKAKKASKMTIWSPALLTRLGLASLQEHAKHADYLVFNEHEAAQIALVDDGAAACRKLSDVLGCKVVTTLGSRGCVFCWNGAETIVPPMDLASYSLKVASTAGAGDTFVGTFAALKTRGLGDLEALFTANIAAALKTTKEEARGSPTFDEVSRYRNDARMRSLFSGIKVR
ncbi:MAG TPA: PfkB family carbohydrate kinase [Nitrososphaera sp.]|jgi:ribokinase